jgi:hypothetical protein
VHILDHFTNKRLDHGAAGQPAGLYSTIDYIIIQASLSEQELTPINTSNDALAASKCIEEGNILVELWDYKV